MSGAPAGGHLRGIILLIGGVSLFAMVDGLSKLLTGQLGLGQMLLARYALALPILLAMTPARAWPNLFLTRRPGLQIIRGLLPLAVSLAMVVGVQHLPLAEATVIMFAGPFVVVALSGPLLGEKVPLASWIGVALGFAAVLMVVRPGFDAFSIWMLFPLAGALLYAVFQLVSGSLASAGEDSTATLAWTHSVGLIGCLPFVVYDWMPLSGHALLLAGLTSLAFAIGHLLIVRAFALAPANLLSPFTYTQIVGAVLFGLIAFGDMPDGWTIAGILVMCASGIYVVRAGRS